MKHLNLVGPQVKRLRLLRGWTQEMLSAKLQLAGWNISRESLDKLEARTLYVGDHQLFFLAKVFEISVRKLFPKIDPQAPNLLQIVNCLMHKSIE